MPAPLTEPYERCTWRVETETMDALRAIYPGRVNEVVRVVLKQFAQRSVAQLKAQQNQAVAGAVDPAA